MARIKGVDIPNNKRIEIALTYIYGIGRNLSNQILSDAGVNKNTKAGDLNNDELAKIRDEVNKYLTEADKLCFSRKQAKTNGTEGYGVKVDETTGFAAWHTATKINKEDPFMYYVDTNGSFNDCWCGAEYVGFRPAMWLDLTKEDE